MILVVNAGSSSIKYTLFDLDGLGMVADGQVERIGTSEGVFKHAWKSNGEEFRQEEIPLNQPDHRAAFERIGNKLLETSLQQKSTLQAIGHRLVHGGEAFSGSVRITQAVKDTVRKLIPLAPLHNPPNLLGVEIAEEIFPDVVQVGVFDTAFHQTIPDYAYRYAVPEKYYREFGIRKYGFHGTSHQFVTETCQTYFGKEDVNLIIAHLGNGASMTAVKAGKSVENSMGMGPLPGLVMGTRSGDIDPSLIFHLVHEYGWDLTDIETDLNKNSGLKGVGGYSDLREIESSARAGDGSARLALDMYVYRIRQFIGSYLAVLGKTDALVFTAGVGENSATIRRSVVQGLGNLGFGLDEQKNKVLPEGPVKDISAAESPVKLLVVPTDEERQIAREVLRLLG
jgi:acetate kinase